MLERVVETAAESLLCHRAGYGSPEVTCLLLKGDPVAKRSLVRLRGSPYDGLEFGLPEEPGYPFFDELILRVSDPPFSDPHEFVYRENGIDAESLFDSFNDDLSPWLFELVEQSKLMAVHQRLQGWYKQLDAERMGLIGQLQRSQKRVEQAQARARRAEEKLKELRKELREAKRKEARGKEAGGVGREA